MIVVAVIVEQGGSLILCSGTERSFALAEWYFLWNLVPGGNEFNTEWNRHSKLTDREFRIATTGLLNGGKVQPLDVTAIRDHMTAVAAEHQKAQKRRFDKDIHDKVSSVLKQLSFKETTSGKEDGNKSIQNSKEVNEESTSEANGNFFDGEINLVSNDKDNNEGSDSDEHSDKHEESSEESNSEQDSESDENLEDNNEDSEDNSDVYGMDVKWKENLAQKAKDSFVNRQNTNHNIMKLVYGVFDSKHNFVTQESESSSDDEDNIGGLFKKASRDQEKLKLNKDSMNLTESSLMLPWGASTRDWLDTENKALIANCFVTGKWKESEDAAELLKLDDTEDLSDVNSEIFGDFEDLETGQKFETSKLKTDQKQAEKRKREDSEKDEEADKQALVEKKRKLKEKFDAEYDNTEKTSYYDDLKMTAEKQAQLNKTVFDSMPDEVRVQIEGFRAGMYVRIEFENVPAEFITNFDPTYPLVIGALNMGEENIGYVNVRIKKHRWYNKILKTNDPLIISLGWRRFQTIPLYSKLEDDLKYRYLKYTPEHLACNAHFWGPITPQGTGFLALQVVDSSQEVVKKLGFRIAATGTVQELDKSTQIMKKLKLIGYPLKIYKKTAFVKGMFNSALEVAKFEGARIKTVSGIRGQIKKAVNKPEGCFRATFEDKIQLSVKVDEFEIDFEEDINNQISDSLENDILQLQDEEIDDEIDCDNTDEAYHFQRDDVALLGFYKYFKEASEEEREHAYKLLEYQNKRGGRVVLTNIEAPEKQEWHNAAEAMNAALDLEKRVNEGWKIHMVHLLLHENDKAK
ncbi:ribosome biogenesis protein BMS1 homolog [Anoplophora glabripennis]|uniref:ribosome biogenesis protein BMS1 homolog n=1 Tax=Anoplophora glabripennis TaxID=217634 RepID=UPI000C770409|nr:ribosome biogenesis protein BMS1 homolog [Anoplophora glabripennis]